jgi:solute carrier family 25 folate transporter 32
MDASNGPPSITVETIAGLSAGFTTTVITHPLDFFKLRLQLDTTTSSQWQAVFKIYKDLLIASKSNSKSNGKVTVPNFIKHLYRGIGPNLIGSTSAWALYFLFYRQFKNLFLNSSDLNHDRHLKSWHYLSSAFLAGWTTSILTNPIWVIKTRMISTERSSPGAYTSIINGIKSIYQKEGFIGYYRGLLPALFNVAQGAVQLSLYDIIKRHLINQHDDKLDENLSTFQYFYASSISKMLSTCMFYPLQVVRSRLQIISSSNKLKSVSSLCIQMYQREGVRSFYKGLAANLLRVLPATCTTFLIYEKVKQLLL